MDPIRILFLADTHLGLDLPDHPRIDRRRRGQDFFDNFQKALAPAREGRVDLVVHGGDLLFRSKVSAGLVAMAMAPLKDVAERGVPVVLVPGNHERSQAPRGLLALHPNIHIFDRPRTFAFDIKGIRLALGGFPFERENVRRDFRRLLDETGLMDAKADGRLLCLHQTVEGAVVGPTGYVFRDGSDVIRSADLPLGIEAVLSGHIHRFQALTTDLRGRPLAAPVFYPGSVERTSFAERDESKGYLTMEISTEADTRGRLAGWSFHALPTRPMVAVDVLAVTMDEAGLRESIRTVLKSVPANGVVQVRLHGPLSADAAKATTADALRALTPPTMNVYVRLMDPPAAPSQVPAPASRGYTHSDIIVPPRRSAALSTRPPRKPQAASGWLFG